MPLRMGEMAAISIMGNRRRFEKVTRFVLREQPGQPRKQLSSALYSRDLENLGSIERPRQLFQVSEAVYQDEDAANQSTRQLHATVDSVERKY
jgi:hypothetical protein